MPLPAQLRFGVRRAFPVGLAAATLLLASMVVDKIAGSGGLWELWIPLALAMAAFTVIVVGMPMVVFFNRPRWAVAPPYRTELGALVAWLMQHKERKDK